MSDLDDHSEDVPGSLRIPEEVIVDEEGHGISQEDDVNVDVQAGVPKGGVVDVSTPAK